jgi:hypothetical protein
MSLSSDSTKRLFEAVTDQLSAGPEIVDAINAGAAHAASGPWQMAAVIVASHASATTDFGALAVGDKVIHIAAGAAPANVNWATVVTAGTNPDGAGVIGDLYIAIRAFSAPASVKGVVKL